MKRESNRLLIVLGLIIAVIAAVIATATGTLQNQKPNGANSRPSPLEKAAGDFYTVVDFETPLPTEINERTRHQARAKRSNMEAGKGVDPARFAITEERESSFGGPPTDMPREVALPAAQSDAVVIGDVTDAKAFLSEDKTDVMSEFAVQVTEVLKDNKVDPIVIGNSMTVVRGGGGVRFPSGKIIREGQGGRPLPRLGRRYLFFLKYSNDEGRDYSIVTAYEINQGKVSPLDGIGLTGNVDPAYSAYQKYDGADEAAFLVDVRDAIIRN